MSDKNTPPLVTKRAGRPSYWSSLLTIGAIALILAVVAAPLWR